MRTRIQCLKFTRPVELSSEAAGPVAPLDHLSDIAPAHSQASLIIHSDETPQARSLPKLRYAYTYVYTYAYVFACLPHRPRSPR